MAVAFSVASQTGKGFSCQKNIIEQIYNYWLYAVFGVTISV
jgi:hypothetical protein